MFVRLHPPLQWSHWQRQSQVSWRDRLNAPRWKRTCAVAGRELRAPGVVFVCLQSPHFGGVACGGGGVGVACGPKFRAARALRSAEERRMLHEACEALLVRRLDEVEPEPVPHDHGTVGAVKTLDPILQPCRTTMAVGPSTAEKVPPW